MNILDKEQLCRSILFTGFADEEIERLLTALYAHVKEYQKGAVIYSSGTAITALGVVISGAVYIQQIDLWGNLNILHEIGAADIFGEAFAVHSGILLNNDVVAAQNVRIVFIPVAWVFTPEAVDTPLKVRFIQNLYRISSARNRYLTQKLRYLACRSTRSKILAYLSDQAQFQHSKSFDIPFDRQQLADYLSVERSALSAELSKMQADGLLTFKKNAFTLLHSADAYT